MVAHVRGLMGMCKMKTKQFLLAASYPVKLMFVLAVLLLPVSMVGKANAQDIQEIDGSKTPELIPDSVAYLHFFMVMRTLPPPHWSLEVKVNYLKDTGLTEAEVDKIVQTANSYFDKIKPIDEEIKILADQFEGRSPSSEAIAKTIALLERKKFLLDEHVSNLLTTVLSLDAARKVSDFLPRVKRSVRIHVPVKNVAVKPSPLAPL